MLLVCHHDLVIRTEAEAGEHDRAAARGRIGKCNVQRIDVEHGCEARPRLFAEREAPLEPLLPAPPVLEIVSRLVDHRVGRRTRDRPVRARVEIRVALEHGELRAGFLEGHPTWSSTGAWSETSRPSTLRRSSGHTSGGVDGRPRTRI